MLFVILTEPKALPVRFGRQRDELGARVRLAALLPNGVERAQHLQAGQVSETVCAALTPGVLEEEELLAIEHVNSLMRHGRCIPYAASSRECVALPVSMAFVSTPVELSRDRLLLGSRGYATAAADTTKLTREMLIEKLNEDLAREYQAIIAYTVYSQVLKGAEYMAIAGELEVHAGQELKHALTIAKQIDYLGGMPTTTALPVKQSDDSREMLRADLDNENDTVRAYRERVTECEALQEYAMAEDIREISCQEQEHQIDLATALGEEVPNLSSR